MVNLLSLGEVSNCFLNSNMHRTLSLGNVEVSGAYSSKNSVVTHGSTGLGKDPLKFQLTRLADLLVVVLGAHSFCMLPACAANCAFQLSFSFTIEV